jgi:PAS domain S-box-containing protein
MTTDSAQSSHTARSTRRARHDLAEALNVIGLAADVGGRGVVDPRHALQQIAALVKEAGDHLDALEEPLGAAESDRSDLTDRGAAVDQATAQANILEGVVRHAPLTESLDAITVAIENQLPETACSVLLLRNGCSLHHGAGAKLPRAYREAIDGVRIGLGQGSCGTAAFTRQPVVASDVTTDQNWAEFRDVANTHGLRSCWSTPIVAAEGGEVLGTFAVYKTTVWTPDRAAVRLVERFTYLAAVAIEHHRLFGALAESESRFRSAFEGAASGMALVRLDGRLIEVNPAMSTMLGPREHAPLTTTLLDLIDPAHRGLVTDAWDRLARGAVTHAGDQRSIEVPLGVPHEPDTVWVSLSTSIITDQSGGQRYFYVVVRDISADRRHLEEQRARKIAEAANTAKSDFLALVSHELRTPLNAILGFAQVMQMVDLDLAQRTDGVDQIVLAGSHLRDLINELLDLSRIEAGQLSVETEGIDPVVAVGEVLDLVRPLANSRDIELLESPPTVFIPQVHADRRCLRQVLINLVANAVKYTPIGGRVRVDVTAVPDDMVRIGVTDSGPGISPDSIADVFQPFHRLERDGHESSEGTGLGLALSARLMNEMNGTIGVESTPGTGSCFWVEFPRTVVSSAPGCDQIGQLVDLFDE